MKRLNSFCKDASEDDMLIIYYSGHGGLDENNDNYILASNTINEDTRIYLDSIVYHLERSKAKTKLLIFDCCHADYKEAITWKKFDTESALDKLYQAGITAFYSCQKDECSNPYNNMEVSAFTKFLCDAIYDKHFERNGTVYFYDLIKLVDIYRCLSI